MANQAEKIISLKASKSYDFLLQAVNLFEGFIQGGSSATSQDYYRGRNFLKEGKIFFEETIKEAKKMLGPLPDYASEDYIQWRQDILDKGKILVRSEDLDAIKDELTSDDIMSKIMPVDEIDAFTNEHFVPQQTGKRKLAHIKARIIICKLQDLIEKAQELQTRALIKTQS